MPDNGNLTHLVTHAMNGHELDLSGRPAAGREIRAEWIRNIVTGVKDETYEGDCTLAGICPRT